MDWARFMNDLKKTLRHLLPVPPSEPPPPAKEITDAETRLRQRVARLDALGVYVDVITRRTGEDDDRVPTGNRQHL